MPETESMRLVLVSGLSGSGKSVALNVIEDIGYYCVDNLPVNLLAETVQLLRDEGTTRVAVSVDVRSGGPLDAVPATIQELKAKGVEVRPLFLDAKNDTLIRRFAETRRRHPLARGDLTLDECLAAERELLSPLAEIGQRIDTSDLHPGTLRSWLRELLEVDLARPVLLLESFAYKRGIPLDADLVFDVRCLPNPFYEPRLRALTGLDAEVAAFLKSDPQAGRMLEDVRGFVETWLPAYIGGQRSHLTVALGCTGGQHRSVYMVERLAAHFRTHASVVVRHRGLSR